MRKFLAIVLSVFCLTACAEKELELIAPIPPDTVITLEVAPSILGCDICREYKIFVFADGLVIFDAIDLAEKLEVSRFHIESEKVRELVNEFQESGFFKLRSAYVIGDDDCINPVIHGWQVIFSIQLEGKIKTVGHYSGCPNIEGRQELKLLWNLREKIEEVTGIDKRVSPFIKSMRSETRVKLKEQKPYDPLKK